MVNGAEELTAAADRLDALSDAHEGRTWVWTGVGDHGYPQRVSSLGDAALIAETYNDPDWPHPAAEFIATMHPGVGKAIAAWLREVQEYHRLGVHGLGDGALAVARIINGSAHA